MIPPAILHATRRAAVDAALDALGKMTTSDLDDLSKFGDAFEVRIAAELVHLGRTTNVPPHPPAPIRHR